MRFFLSLPLLFLNYAGLSAQHIQEPDIAGDNGGVHCNSPLIKTWAAKCKILRGPVKIDSKDSGFASAGDEAACLGKADNVTVSLGDGGAAILSFNEPVADINGGDFAIFENSFDGNFLELAFAEVSSDSVRWVRFPSVSETPSVIQLGPFDTLDAAKIHNLAGKYKVLYGTPFDLADIKDSLGIDVMNIRFIRIIDVTGCISDPYASYDSRANKINDPWPTPFPQSGFDLDAVAILRSVTHILTGSENTGVSVFPNPASDIINVLFGKSEYRTLLLRDITGKPLIRIENQGESAEISLYHLINGIYFLEVMTDRGKTVYKIVKK